MTKANVYAVNVLFATPAYWPAVAFGGPIWVARNLTEGLVRRGHRVDVVTTSLRSIGAPPASRSRTSTRVVDGVAVHELATPLRYRWMGITPTLPLRLQSLPKPDIVHVFGFRDVVTTVTAAWCRARRIPYVFEPLDMIVPQFRNIPVKRAFDRVLGDPVVRGAQLVIANSGREREQLVAADIEVERIVIRPNGFPPIHDDRGTTLRTTLGIGPDVPLVLNVGRLSFKKGLDVLLEVIASLPEVQLAIVGPDDGDGTRELLERRASLPDLAGRVALLPPLDEQQPRELYGEADIFVLPSRNESFGMVAAEAAAAGVAIVVTDRCGVAELLADAAMVVPMDAEAIRTAIGCLLEDAELRGRLGRAGQAVARSTSWGSIVDLQEGLYSRVIAD